MLSDHAPEKYCTDCGITHIPARCPSNPDFDEDDDADTFLDTHEEELCDVCGDTPDDCICDADDDDDDDDEEPGPNSGYYGGSEFAAEGGPAPEQEDREGFTE